MWQQNSYLSDSGIQSGIQSGAVTQAPSLSGKEDEEMEGDQLMFDLDSGFAQGFTQDQVDGKNLDPKSHYDFEIPMLRRLIFSTRDEILLLNILLSICCRVVTRI